MTDEKMMQVAINTIRTLSMDAVQQAKSGHPGTPMALAPLVYKQNPQSSRQNSRPNQQIYWPFLILGSKPFHLKLFRCCYTCANATEGAWVAS
jgi:Transketolase, thiamine diphosphate binding domain